MNRQEENMMNYPKWEPADWTETRFSVTMKDENIGLEQARDPKVLAWVREENKTTDQFFDQHLKAALEKKKAELRRRPFHPSYSALTQTEEGYWACRSNADGTRTLVLLNTDFQETASADLSMIDSTITVFTANPSPKRPELIYYTGLQDGADRPCVLVVNCREGRLIRKLDGIFSSLWDVSGSRILYSDADADPKAGVNVNHIRSYDCDRDQITTHFDYQDNAVLIRLACSAQGEEVIAEIMENYEDTVIFRMRQDGGFEPVSVGMKGAFSYVGFWQGKHFYLTQQDAPLGRIVSLGSDQTMQQATTVIAQSEMKLEDAVFCKGQLVLFYLKDAASLIRICTPQGELIRDLELPCAYGACTLAMQNAHAIRPTEDLILSFESFIHEPMCLKYDGETLSVLTSSAAQPPQGIEVRQIFTEAPDGVRIPAFMVMPQGWTPRGDTPTLMYGYGGYNNAVLPSYNNPFVDLDIVDWVKQGRIYVSINLRGGSEYGTPWHLGGCRENKKNCFTDFIATAQRIQREGWTCPEKTAICGGSNGGLLMCALLTMRPDLWGCVIASVPHTDMIRFRNDDRGPMYITEYGDPMDPKMFEYMLSYSPYHNIQQIAYPAVYIQTGECDNNVPPYHGKKMAARLQQCQRGDRPVLLRVLALGSHDRGKGEAHLQTISEMQSFIEWALQADEA